MSLIYKKKKIFNRFRIEILNREPTILTAAVVLNSTLDYNQRTIYHFNLQASVSIYKLLVTFKEKKSKFVFILLYLN